MVLARKLPAEGAAGRLEEGAAARWEAVGLDSRRHGRAPTSAHSAGHRGQSLRGLVKRLRAIPRTGGAKRRFEVHARGNQLAPRVLLGRCATVIRVRRRFVRLLTAALPLADLTLPDKTFQPTIH